MVLLYPGFTSCFYSLIVDITYGSVLDPLLFLQSIFRYLIQSHNFHYLIFVDKPSSFILGANHLINLHSPASNSNWLFLPPGFASPACQAVFLKGFPFPLMVPPYSKSPRIVTLIHPVPFSYPIKLQSGSILLAPELRLFFSIWMIAVPFQLTNESLLNCTVYHHQVDLSKHNSNGICPCSENFGFWSFATKKKFFLIYFLNNSGGVCYFLFSGHSPLFPPSFLAHRICSVTPVLPTSVIWWPFTLSSRGLMPSLPFTFPDCSRLTSPHFSLYCWNILYLFCDSDIVLGYSFNQLI